MNTVNLKITGMTCGSCAKLNESAILAIDGVKSAKVNIANNKAQVEFNEKKTSTKEIIETIEKIGYGAFEMLGMDHDMGEENEKETRIARNRFIGAAIFTIPVFTAMVAPDLATGVKWLGIDLIMWGHMAFTAIVVFVFGWHFHKSAAKKLMHLKSNMDSLVSLGTLSSFFYSF